LSQGPGSPVAHRWKVGQGYLTNPYRRTLFLHRVALATTPVAAALAPLLEPDITSPLTQAKLGLVLLIGWNGLLATWLHARLSRDPGRLRLRCICAATASVSQLGWWGAMVIGFLHGR
jgi:hypothetical protein